MKAVACWAVVLWLGFVLENSQHNLFSSCSLVLPLAVGCVFWLRNGYAVLLAGTAMLVRWLLQPTAMPIEIFVVLVASAWANSQSSLSSARSNSRASTKWMLPTVITLLGIASHAAAISFPEPNSILEFAVPRVLVATPVIAVVLLASCLADELGLRKIPA